MDRRTKHIAISCLVGFVYLVIALNSSDWVHGRLTLELVPYSLLDARLDEQLLFGSMYPGLFLLGTVSTYTYLRWGFVSPGLVVLVPFLIALWFEAQTDPAQADLVSPVGIYLFAWFAVLFTVIVAAGLEWSIRRLRPFRDRSPDGL